MTKEILELAQQLLDAAHYCTQLEKLEDHCREVARRLEALAEDGEPQDMVEPITSNSFTMRIREAGPVGLPQNPPPLGNALRQISEDDGQCDLAALWQVVIDNTKGGGFWLGEILLTTIEQETGFNGSAHTRQEGKRHE